MKVQFIKKINKSFLITVILFLLSIPALFSEPDKYPSELIMQKLQDSQGNVFNYLYSYGSPEKFFDNFELSKVRIKVAPADAELTFCCADADFLPYLTTQNGSDDYYRVYNLPMTELKLKARSKGYEDLEFFFKPGDKEVEIKLERKNTGLKFLRNISTGWQPKSVEVIEGTDWIVVADLGEQFSEAINTVTGKRVVLNFPDADKKHCGFVESVVLKGRNELLISQMTRSKIHVFDVSTFKYKRSFSSGGNFPKVITVAHDESKIYVSNWISKTVSEINPATGKTLRKFKVGTVPRGMVLSPDGTKLITALFEGPEQGKSSVIDLKTGKVEVKAVDRFGAKRHIVADYNKKRYYFSDMWTAKVAVTDLTLDKKLKDIKVWHKPNTIKLTPDGRYLFVSCRGPNHPKSYLRKSPQFGKVYVIDCQTLKVKTWIWGKNQPTGLALDHSRKLLYFSDFLDATVEVYSYAGLYPEPQKEPLETATVR